MRKKLEIEILFPVLNEHKRLERGITGTVKYLREHPGLLSHADFKLTIIDNGSDDDTPEIGKRLAKMYPCVTYRRIEERGVGIAFATGVRESLADVIGQMDIDLSADIRNIAKVVKILLEHPEVDYVNGTRFSRRSKTIGRKAYRKLTSLGMLLLLKVGFSMKATDALCGFTWVRKKTAERIAEKTRPEKGWFYMIEFLLRAERMGVRIVDLPVVFTEDYDTTVHVGKTILNYLKNLMRLRIDLWKETDRA
ncbi:MAG: glycosyltransferase [Lachnospiraceae bacterium]|nr:glycosyltransferase [Lachnospiraceae bacterium]